MSVVVFDGKSLCSDCQGTNYGHRSKVSKITETILTKDGHKYRYILAWVGLQSSGLMMRDWWIAGAKPEEFPHFSGGEEEWSRLIVADSLTKKVVTYEQKFIALPVLDDFSAWGSGRDYSIGAMAMGATARQAVEVACQFSTDCGLGVEEYFL